jgi:tetratricopeptide (TPR) repeat protein
VRSEPVEVELPPATATVAEREEPAAKADAGEPIAAAPSAGSEPSDEIDLNNVLGDFKPADKPQPIPLSKMPSFDSAADADSAAARQGADHQSAQHMTLARTYLEMGLADEAIGPLETASKTPRFRFEAASTLGRLYKNQGETARAIEWLERAAEAPAPSEEESRALLYDLGTMIEESGDTTRALAVFLELQSEAGDYRDVAERVERLARVETGG